MEPGTGPLLPATRADFPLVPGAVWSYRTEDAVDTGEKGLDVRRGTRLLMVLSVHRHGELTVAVIHTRERLNGEPTESLAWRVVDGDRVYTIEEQNELRFVLDAGSSALRSADADLVFPIGAGRRWGDSRQLERHDGLYVSQVLAGEELDLPAGRLKAWPIVYATLPERSTTWFTPGIGVVRYEYTHNGALGRESYELIEFRRDVPDTLALIRELDTVVRRLTDYPDFWPIRAGLVEDPELRALLGPLTQGPSVEQPDGVRRHVLQGDGTTLTFLQALEGANRVTRVEWRNRSGVIHLFGAWEGRASHAVSRGS